MSAPQVAMGVLTGIQTIGQIQNARYQANLAERQARESLKQAEMQKTQLQIEGEQERVKLAQEEIQRLRKAKETIATDIAAGAASGALMQGNVFLNESLKNLSEDLNILRTERDLIMQKTKGAVGNLMASAYEKAAITRAAGEAARQAGYVSAIGTLAKGGMQTYAMGPSSVTTPTGMEGPVNLGKGNI